MMNMHTLPLFLWEHAIQHTVYLQNWAYTKALKETTPFQIWTGGKPSVKHLREFRAPIWILRQGQNKGHKFEPKSLQKIFLGFDDGSKSVKYYNPETRKILTSRNYHFLTLSDKPLPQTNAIEIDITPDVLREGESSGTALKSDPSSNQQCEKRKSDETNPETYKRNQESITNYLMTLSRMMMMMSMRLLSHLPKSYMLCLLTNHMEATSQKP